MSTAGSGRGAMIPLTKLWQRTSAKGNVYFYGYLGTAKVLIVENRDRQSEKDASHILLVAENPPKEPKQ